MALESGQSGRSVEGMTTTDTAAGQAAFVEVPVRFDFDALAQKTSRAVGALARDPRPHGLEPARGLAPGP